MQIREGGSAVEDIVAVTMGPRERRARAAQGGLAGRGPLGAPHRRRRSRAPTWPPPATRSHRRCEREQPRSRAARPAVRRRRVLHDRRGRRRAPRHALAHPGHQDGRRRARALRCERQAEYGYDTVQVRLPAVISVGDAINEPRYPSLKAIMGAKKKPLETLAAADAQIDAVEGRRRELRRASSSPSRRRRRSRAARSSRTRTRTRRSSASWPGSRSESSSKRIGEQREQWRTSWSTHCTTKVAINKNSLGAVSESARLASELGGEAHAILVGESVSRRSRGLGRLLRRRPRRSSPRGRRASRSRSSTRWRRRSRDGGYKYAIFGGGLLGFEIGAGLAARLGRGRRDGGHATVRVARRRADRRTPDPRRLRDLGKVLPLRRRHRHRPPQRLRGPKQTARGRRRSSGSSSSSARTRRRRR